MRDEILSDIRRLAEANNGKPPGRRLFELETGVREADWLGIYWARWGDAVEEAGLTPNVKQGRIDDAVILETVAHACRHFRRVPTSAELKMLRRDNPTFPAEETLRKRFNGKEDMLDRLAAWVSDKPKYVDVAAMLGPRPAIPHRVPPQAVARPPAEGFVYLIRSGPHYKIGRSDELERRVKEIRVALPEAATLVHSIRTDDPPGIETYWHRRFADRKANGEWFRLTTADVAAFKRRRYQ